MLVNLTPHAIRVLTETGELVAEFPPSGDVARLNQDFPGDDEPIEGCPVVRAPRVTGVVGIPGGCTEILVSGFVASFLADHNSLFGGKVYSPDTSPKSVQRDSEGRIKGVLRLQRWL